MKQKQRNLKIKFNVAFILDLSLTSFGNFASFFSVHKPPFFWFIKICSETFDAETLMITAFFSIIFFLFMV